MLLDFLCKFCHHTQVTNSNLFMVNVIPILLSQLQLEYRSTIMAWPCEIAKEQMFWQEKYTAWTSQI